MFMHKSKKGFTIVELVIVIAVIAILAAVLIPTFSNLVKKANQSADIQAARQMNTVLAAEGAVEKNNIFEVYEALAANGMTAKDYRPLTTDHYFFWDDEADRIVYTDKNYQVLFPADFEKQGNWVSLTAKIPTRAPASFTATSASVAVKSAEELAYIVEQVKDNQVAEGLAIDLGGQTLDMMGASMNMANSAKGEVTKSFTLKNGSLKNVTVIDAANLSTSNEEGKNGQYNAGGLFGNVKSGKTVSIENVTIENINIQNTHVSGAAILVANSAGATTTINIKDVKIKNSTVIAHRNAGALVGYVGNGVTLNLSGTIELENVHVKTVGGRCGMLVGYCDGTINDESTIKMTNCTYELLKCDQNTGTSSEGDPLGLQSSGAVYSWCYDGDGDYDYNTDKFFDANALVMVAEKNAAGEVISQKANNSLFKNVTGW